MSPQHLILKKGKEKAIKNFHHWIFSGAIQKMSEVENGDFVSVHSYEGEMLGSAYVNKKTSITGRMVSFDTTPPLLAIEENIKKAIAFRSSFFDNHITNAYRLINSEGDNIPGLIVDKYNDILVIQVATLGIEKIKEHIISLLVRELQPVDIYEKSDIPSRREEGLDMFEGLLYGQEIQEVEILENNVRFLVSFKDAQKTGFFLDQREMRNLVKQYAKNRNVLNCFSYTGGFSLYALLGGAKRVTTLDISEQAIDMAKKNFERNHCDIQQNDFVVGNVFEFLRKDILDYDFIILDPPAFAKKKSDIMKACRGYKDINYQTLKKIPKGSLLLTCSCSYYVDEKLFQTVVFQAAKDANRKVRIMQRHHLAIDHPINIFHPEGDYLKSLLLFVE